MKKTKPREWWVVLNPRVSCAVGTYAEKFDADELCGLWPYCEVVRVREVLKPKRKAKKREAMKSLGKLEVATAEVRRGELVLEDFGAGRKVTIVMDPGTAAYLAEKLNEWLRDRRAELNLVQTALEGG